MTTLLSQLQSPAAVQTALDEFVAQGRTGFLEHYGFGKARDYLVRDPQTGTLCDAKAIVAVAFGKQFPESGPLKPTDLTNGDAIAVKLQALGFAVTRTGEDWSLEEVRATVSSYFEMLNLEARGHPYTKTQFNASLRERLNGRSKAAVELKHQNISAVLHDMDLPFIPGYKPRGNVQLLLRKEVHQFILTHPDTLTQIVNALQEARDPAEQPFRAVLVDPPRVRIIKVNDDQRPWVPMPRKVDFAARDEVNRRLGRAGEQWAIAFEQRRLTDAGCPELFDRVEWISDELGDGMGYDILSYDAPGAPRYIEVKTTNGPHESPFVISRNELRCAREMGDAFFLYRIFSFRQSPSLYMLRGDVSRHLHLEPIDYRASFRQLRA
ncbi:DUF3883 domain-containing protein [Cupriavidus cauae]|uniref:DUF3883 domain-containing protein n=1 Tax=Cupriavidus cauae TaxID=2608999 RepID=UPI0011EB9FCA|nr:DUF3883 domain-containing protein [Cupriavidus cauae]KAA0182323.1 DUF3883 domain-containing protein [Cupriavidus gilardii]UZN48998.1 DUF3883 domain-containing protein [Cupriavidus cauae]